MPLSVDNIVQTNSGSFVAASGAATLAATTAGNTILLICGGTGGTMASTGFTLIKNSGLTAATGSMQWKNTTGGETSWTVTNTSPTAVTTWVLIEVQGLDQYDALDLVATTFGSGTGSTLATPATLPASTYDGMVLAFHACEDLTSATPGTWSGHTGGLTELVEVGGNNGTISVGLSVSVAFTYNLALQTWASTATKTPAAGQAALACICVLTAEGAKRAGDILACTGFEFGTVAGITTGIAPGKNFETVTGTPAIVTSTPRSGTYCLELTSAAAAENLLWGRASNETLFGLTNQIPVRLSIYFPTSLPSADLVLYTLEPFTAADNVVVRYVNASQKLGVKVGTGTEVLSDATVTANQWISVDMRVDGRTTTGKCDWRVDYLDTGTATAQTQATGTTVAVTAGWGLRLGWTAASTGTVRYDDVVVGRVGGHYPLGNTQVLAITPDPAGTLTLSGTAANFQTFTANGTLAAWNAATALTAIDELPPTIGASADGFAQITTATTEYVEVPMTTVNAANLGASIRGVRMLACGWASSTTASTIGFRAWDGTAELNLNAAGNVDREFDNSTTAPSWVAKMVKDVAGRYDWTQAALDALAFRVGFSSSATQKPGIHAIYGEVALRVGDLIRVIDVQEGLFTVDWRMDPDSSGVIQAIITTPVDRGAYYSITVSGTPIEVNVPANTVHTIYVGATDITTVTEQTLIPGTG